MTYPRSSDDNYDDDYSDRVAEVEREYDLLWDEHMALRIEVKELRHEIEDLLQALAKARDEASLTDKFLHRLNSHIEE